MEMALTGDAYIKGICTKILYGTEMQSNLNAKSSSTGRAKKERRNRLNQRIIK